MALAIAGGATAASGSASVSPATSVPGERLGVVFTVETSDPIEVVVQERIRCVAEGPAEVTMDCTGAASIADVRVLPGSRQYAFSIEAPSEQGDYTVTLTRETTLGVPSAGAVATATFAVVPQTAPGAETPLTDASEQLLDEPLDDAAGDAGRWLASSTMATAALAGAIVVGRRSLGGLR